MTIDTKDKLVELLQVLICFGIALTLLYGCTSDEDKAKQVQVQAKAEAQRIAKAEQCAEAKTRVLAEGFLIMDQVNSFPDEDRLKRWQASTLDCP